MWEESNIDELFKKGVEEFYKIIEKPKIKKLKSLKSLFGHCFNNAEAITMLWSEVYYHATEIILREIKGENDFEIVINSLENVIEGFENVMKSNYKSEQIYFKELFTMRYQAIYWYERASDGKRNNKLLFYENADKEFKREYMDYADEIYTNMSTKIGNLKFRNNSLTITDPKRVYEDILLNIKIRRIEKLNENDDYIEISPIAEKHCQRRDTLSKKFIKKSTIYKLHPINLN